MTIQRGDFVRPNTTGFDLPRGSVWRVICADGGLKLAPENNIARWAASRTVGCRFPAGVFEKVVLCSGQWVLPGEEFYMRERINFDPGIGFALYPAKARFDAATAAAGQAADTTATINSMLEAARKLEAERQEELRAAKAAQAKAEKEAAARAKVEEARKALAAKLHADRCLAEATLELIAEVSRMNNGGSEWLAHHSIASHAGQLQPLAKSYGYRIVKPSMLAMVIKI